MNVQPPPFLSAWLEAIRSHPPTASIRLRVSIEDWDAYFEYQVRLLKAGRGPGPHCRSLEEGGVLFHGVVVVDDPDVRSGEVEVENGEWAAP